MGVLFYYRNEERHVCVKSIHREERPLTESFSGYGVHIHHFLSEPEPQDKGKSKRRCLLSKKGS